MSTANKKLQATAQLFHYHGSMGHSLAVTYDPWTDFHLWYVELVSIGWRL